MRTIRNLAWFLLAFGLTVWAGTAFAQDRYYSMGSGTDIRYSLEGYDPLCREYVASRPAGPGTVLRVDVATRNCIWRAVGSSTGQISTAMFLSTCPVAKPNFDWATKTCIAAVVPPNPCIPGEAVEVTYKIGPVVRPYGSGYYPYSPREPHDGQCNLNCTDSPKSKVRHCFARGGDDFCSYTCEKNGNVKSSNEDGNAPSAPQESTDPRKDVPPFESSNGPCPKGTVNAGLSDSGVPMCMGTGSDPKNKPPAPPKLETEKTETSEDGTKTTTKTETITNSDGSKTTTTTVTITKPDGTKQVDQQKDTSKTPTNQPGKDDSTKDEEKYDLCKQNPHLTICQNSSVAGKCGEISCAGDAIQCATLRAAAAMQCQQQKDLEDLAKAPGAGLGNAIAQGSDPMKGEIENALKGTEIDLSKPSLDATAFVGAGSCLAPITMTVVGRPVTASFDSVCQNIQPLRYAIMACAYILVYLLVSRSILQG